MSLMFVFSGVEDWFLTMGILDYLSSHHLVISAFHELAFSR